MSKPGGRGWGRPAVRNRRNDRLANLDWREFERVVADYYRGQGFAVEHCGTGGGRSRFDGGIDLKLHRDGEYTIVQCKRENALQVTHNVCHELLGLLLTEKADRAIVVNSGEFTPHAIAAARKEERLQLVDGDQLRDMLPEYAVPEAAIGGASLARQVPDWPLSGPPSRPAPSSVRTDSARRGSQDGTKGLIALAFLVVLVLWQCSYRSKSTQPAVSHAPPVSTPPAPTGSDSGEVAMARAPRHLTREAAPVRRTEPTRQEVAESRRRADEAIRILEATTPELDLPPDPHAVYRD
ncbi:restriction endonuclease [Luteimonas sp. MJ250]|uniref:restriction endonuclease n=1 Tax=Luteimonas sp. MJ250 TaxID=3129236 RepID=UPI0031BA5897